MGYRWNVDNSLPSRDLKYDRGESVEIHVKCTLVTDAINGLHFELPNRKITSDQDVERLCVLNILRNIYCLERTL